MDVLDIRNHPWTIHNDLLELRTEKRTQFIDLTGWVRERLCRSGVEHGFVQVRVLHTTAAIVVNENEPRLYGEFREMLERLAPENGSCTHDDPQRRWFDPDPEERAHGHAHSRALLLGDSRQFNVLEGGLELGRRQSILLVELDGPRRRSISLTLLGHRPHFA